jgi:hypothetical protein
MGSLEGAIALAQQHAQSFASSQDEIEMAIAIKISHRHGTGTEADG